jgi:peptidyl-tRNA hydrolase, PTH2 family
MYKQAMVVRKDLNMSVGKISAQVSHASLEAYKRAAPEAKEAWELGGQKKIVLKVTSEKDLLEYFERCKDAGLKPALIRDAGHTQLEPGTVTCFGVGPAEEKEVDKILGGLKLL